MTDVEYPDVETIKAYYRDKFFEWFRGYVAGVLTVVLVVAGFAALLVITGSVTVK